MGLESAPQSQRDEAPIFEGFRRGYDPEQVDRFVNDQQRRLDETLNRATEAERRLAAAVGQLRELHRRVATLENEGRTPQPQAQPLDTVGERVQRILQESWEGMHAIRQSAEEEAAAIRLRTVEEASEIVASARRKAAAIEEEIEKRRRAYLGRVEEERSRAVAQITYLHDQRKSVVGELVRMKAAIESTVGKVGALADVNDDQASSGTPPRTARPKAAPLPITKSETPTPPERRREARQVLADPMARPRTVRDVSPRTMPVFHLDTSTPAGDAPDASVLVRNHRAGVESPKPEATVHSIREKESHAVFDFEEAQPS